MTEPLLRLSNLEAGYGAVPVLFDVTLEVRSGEIVTLVGSNGAGKTTLLRAVSRIIPSRGTIRFAGSEIASLTPEQVFYRGLVQVPEGRQLFSRMTVEENLLMGAQRQRDQFAIRRAFERVYQLFPVLKDRRRQLAGNMSGGEQQMCALGRALMAAPRLLTVDEMSLGLAPVIVDQLLEILVEIRKQGVTVLLVEQDVFAAFSVADRGYVMETGRIVRTGPVSELAKDESVRRAYLGEMSAEVLEDDTSHSSPTR
jgi:branched-chain amino acid transport system ATP-binding protein